MQKTSLVICIGDLITRVEKNKREEADGWGAQLSVSTCLDIYESTASRVHQCRKTCTGFHNRVCKKSLCTMTWSVVLKERLVRAKQVYLWCTSQTRSSFKVLHSLKSHLSVFCARKPCRVHTEKPDGGFRPCSFLLQCYHCTTVLSTEVLLEANGGIFSLFLVYVKNLAVAFWNVTVWKSF